MKKMLQGNFFALTFMANALFLILAFTYLSFSQNNKKELSALPPQQSLMQGQGRQITSLPESQLAEFSFSHKTESEAEAEAEGESGNGNDSISEARGDFPRYSRSKIKYQHPMNVQDAQAIEAQILRAKLERLHKIKASLETSPTVNYGESTATLDEESLQESR